MHMISNIPESRSSTQTMRSNSATGKVAAPIRDRKLRYSRSRSRDSRREYNSLQLGDALITPSGHIANKSSATLEKPGDKGMDKSVGQTGFSDQDEIIDRADSDPLQRNDRIRCGRTLQRDCSRKRGSVTPYRGSGIISRAYCECDRGSVRVIISR